MNATSSLRGISGWVEPGMIVKRVADLEVSQMSYLPAMSAEEAYVSVTDGGWFAVQ